MRRISAQRGVVLLVVMVLLASAALLAATQLHTQQRHIKLAANRALQAQALWYALAAEDWARIVLQQDRQDNETDSFSDIWANLDPFIELPHGKLSVTLEDAQALLNINALGASGPRREVSVERLGGLLELFAVDRDVVFAIVDWLDSDNEPSGFAGAEDDYYSRLVPAYLAPNALLQHPAELLFVKGIGQSEYAKLAPWVIALGAETTLNVNTAGREILLALGLSPAAVEALIEERKRQPFASVAEFVARAKQLGYQGSPVGLGVASDYFLLTSQVVIGGVSYAQRSLVSRRGDQYRVEWRMRLLPELDAAA